MMTNCLKNVSPKVSAMSVFEVALLSAYSFLCLYVYNCGIHFFKIFSFHISNFSNMFL